MSKENQVIQAEDVKLSRQRDSIARVSRGDKPGIRKRSYHRALKRNELWAVVMRTRKELTLKLLQDFFVDTTLPLTMMGLSEQIKEDNKNGK